MGDCFEKLGELLSQKIQNEEKGIFSSGNEQDNKTEKEPEVVTSDKPENSGKKISPQLIVDALKNKSAVQGEVFPSGTYEEDVPVKIITGEAEFK